jgi:hypothetical protein
MLMVALLAVVFIPFHGIVVALVLVEIIVVAHHRGCGSRYGFANCGPGGKVGDAWCGVRWV